MKHLTYADKNLLTGDEAADMLVRYAAALGNTEGADTVDLECIGSDGDAVTATFVLGQGAPLMAETSTGQLPEPDNSEAISYMSIQMERLLHNPSGGAEALDWEKEITTMERDF